MKKKFLACMLIMMLTITGCSSKSITQTLFVEKNNKTGVSDLYSLNEFSPRKSENIQKGYLQGRYGAMPFVNLEDIEW